MKRFVCCTCIAVCLLAAVGGCQPATVAPSAGNGGAATRAAPPASAPRATSAPAILGEAVMEKEVLERINQFRRQHQLPPLEPRGDLTALARRQSHDMMSLRRLSHAGVDGAGLEARAHRVGVLYQQMSENVAWNRGYKDPVLAAVDGWLSSPGHRRNILLPNMRETGVGVVQDAASGTYYFTQIFCRRLPAEPAKPKSQYPLLEIP